MTDPKAPPRRAPKTLREAARAFFAYGSPRILGAQVLVAALVRPLLGAPRLVDLAVLGGVAAYWPLQEWLLHRHVLHARPVKIGPFVYDNAAARAHREHHRRPLDPATTLLPTWTIAVLVPAHLLLWRVIAPSRAAACTGVLSLGAAALSYEWIHFLTHTAYRPHSRWFAEVKRRHLAHHFEDDERWFAFAVPSIDDWLGTGTPAQGAAPRRDARRRAPSEQKRDGTRTRPSSRAAE